MAVVEQGEVPSEEGVRVRGEVEFWKASDGFGGVMPLGWTHDAPRFRAADVLSSLLPRLYPGMPVEFELRRATGPAAGAGRLRALRITPPGKQLFSNERQPGRVRSFERGFGFVAPDDETAALLAGPAALLYFHRSQLHGPLSACLPGAPVTFILTPSRKKLGEYEAIEVRLLAVPEKRYNDDERAPLGSGPSGGKDERDPLDELTGRMAGLSVKPSAFNASRAGQIDVNELLPMPGGNGPSSSASTPSSGMTEAQTAERLQLLWQESIASLHALLLSLPAPSVGSPPPPEAPLVPLPDSFSSQRPYYWAFAPPLITELRCAMASGASSVRPPRIYRPTQVETVRIHGTPFTLMHLMEARLPVASSSAASSRSADTNCAHAKKADDEPDDENDEGADVEIRSTEGVHVPGDVLVLTGKTTPPTAALPASPSTPLSTSSSSSSSSSSVFSSPVIALVHRARAPSLSLLLNADAAQQCEELLAQYTNALHMQRAATLPLPSSSSFASSPVASQQVLEVHGPIHNVVPHQRLFAALRCGVLTGDVPAFLPGILAPKIHSSLLTVPRAWADDLPPPLVSALETSLNSAQYDAVMRVASLAEGVVLIQGPPGTGKSSTILALLGVLLAQGARPLVCSPANAAVDEIVTRIAAQGLISADSSHSFRPPVALVAAPERVDQHVPALAAALLPPRRSALMAHLSSLKATLPKLASLLRRAEDLLAPPPTPAVTTTDNNSNAKPPTTGDARAKWSNKANAAANEGGKKGKKEKDSNKETKDVKQTEESIEEEEEQEDPADLMLRIARQRDELLALVDLHIALGHAFVKDITQQWSNRLRLPALRALLVALLPHPTPTSPPPALSLLSPLLLPEMAAQLRWVSGAVGDLRDELEKPGEALEVQVLNSSRIVFSTLVASGRLLLRRPELKPFDVLIVDEAAQALEPEVLISLRASIRRLVLVGDPCQLPATVFSPAALAAHFDRPLMMRLMSQGVEAAFLNVQHRMAPPLALWPAKRFYASRLSNAASVSTPQWAPPQHPHSPHSYLFIDLTHAREQRDETHLSLCSPFEADECLRILKALFAALNAPPPSKVGVITFYAAQARLLRERLNREEAPWASAVQVATVDAFQGQEKDVILLSFVRANPRGTVGFLRDMRRLNVALTRARRLLLLIGHAATLRAHPDLADLLDDAKARGLLLSVPAPASLLPEDLPSLRPGGGGGSMLSLQPQRSVSLPVLPATSPSSSSTALAPSVTSSGGAQRGGRAGGGRGEGRGRRGDERGYPAGGGAGGRGGYRGGGVYRGEEYRGRGGKGRGKGERGRGGLRSS